jgi:hydroxymethylpyrimidine/phosphomethylpyrimidine kinase
MPPIERTASRKSEVRSSKSSSYDVRFTFYFWLKSYPAKLPSMQRRRQLPVALTIAGSDSGGGAGIQADLKTFAALGVHGTTAITCITAQNPRAVLGIQACRPLMVSRQLEAVFESFRPAAAKTGMLYSTAIIRAVAEFLRPRRVPLVVDPVMVSTSGAQLLQPAAIRFLKKDLLPLATLVTPNLPEAELLLGRGIRSGEDMRAAARELHRRFACAALVKGGHLRGLKVAVDIFYDGRQELLLSAPFIRGVRTHGTGCTYAAAVTAFLARGFPPARAVLQAKQYITHAIARSRCAGPEIVMD